MIADKRIIESVFCADYDWNANACLGKTQMVLI